jgi:hypothetical protein
MIKLIGRYSLLKHGTYDQAGDYTPTSDYLKGEINYASDGSLSVLILFQPEIESKKDILSYVGRYEVSSENILFHNITLCSQQARNHSAEKRSYLLKEDKLILGSEMPNGFRFEAVWKKDLG